MSKEFRGVLKFVFCYLLLIFLSKKLFAQDNSSLEIAEENKCPQVKGLCNVADRICYTTSLDDLNQ